MRIYLICQIWRNTRGNHAGIYYLCKKISSINPDVKVISLPDFSFRGKRFVYKFIYKILNLYLFLFLRKGDTVVLMEYLLSKTLDQGKIAFFLQKHKSHVKIVALPHLVGSLIDQRFTKEEIIKRISAVNTVWVLGSSLKNYILSLGGIPSSTIKVIYHYVDTEFYKPNNTINTVPEKLRVVIMGNMKRDVDLLYEVVSQLPFIEFDICAGIANYQERFKELINVVVHPYLDEMELKNIMDKSNISLNIMKDTIGSNVIVTSMAMGLVMVVSDVGSIRNYMNEKNAFFCESSTDFIKVLSYLNENKNIIPQMRLESLMRAKEMDLLRFYDWFIEQMK